MLSPAIETLIGVRWHYLKSVGGMAPLERTRHGSGRRVSDQHRPPPKPGLTLPRRPGAHHRGR